MTQRDRKAERLEKALALAGIATATLDRATGTIFFDEAAQSLFRVKPSCPAAAAARLLDARSLALLRERFARGGRTGPFAIDACLDGERCTVEVSADVSETQAFITLRDITAEAAERRTLAEQVEHLWYTVEFNPQLPWFGDTEGRVIGCTDRWLSLTGLTAKEAMGYDGWQRVAHPDDIGRVYSAVMHSLGSGKPLDVRLRVKVKSGEYRWMRAQAFPRRDEEGQVLRWYGYTEDIDDHVLVEQQIRWTAEHDSLTKLPNRLVFHQRLDRALRDEYVPGRKVGLMVIDVDNFKDVNDVLGHDAGDAMLIAFADMLSSALGSGPLLARIGGDEFAVLVESDDPAFDLGQYCERLYGGLKDSIIINGRSIDCRFSIGGAVYPLHGQSPTELFKNADIALYEAKARGKSRFTLFSLEMKQLTQRRVAMINLGREAVEAHAIVPYYQVQVSLEDNRPVGFEALLRHKDRQGRICPPSTIWAAFDDAEVAEALGDAMLSAVLRDIVAAQDEGIDLGTVAINFSTAEFRSNTFVDRLTSKMKDARVSYDQLAIEVTEGVFLGRQADKAVETICELDRLGFKIALDDFGTGYASLLHLRQIPVDSLKIDQSFVRNLVDSKDDLAIVAAIANLGDSLGLDVIAEGIETAEQLKVLRQLNLKLAQGFYFSKPLPIRDACALIRSYDAGRRTMWARKG